MTQLSASPDRDSQSSDLEFTLSDGRRFAFKTHVQHSTRGTSTKWTRLTIFDGRGEELASEVLRRNTGVNVTGPQLCDHLRYEVEQWRVKQQRNEADLAIPKAGRVLWKFGDFVYFSILTQATLDCQEIVPNSRWVRRLVLLHMCLAYSVLVVLVNIAASSPDSVALTSRDRLAQQWH